VEQALAANDVAVPNLFADLTATLWSSDQAKNQAFLLELNLALFVSICWAYGEFHVKPNGLKKKKKIQKNFSKKIFLTPFCR